MPATFRRIPSLVALVVLAAACSSHSGRLQLGVAFPGFQTQAIPPATTEIRLAVNGQSQFTTRLSLTPANPRTLLAGIPVGAADVGAVAFDAAGEPLAGARTSTEIKGGEKVTAILELQAGGFDEALLDAVGRPSKASPSPSPQPSPSASPTPAPASTPASEAPTPEPSTAPTSVPPPDPAAVAAPAPTPTAPPVNGGVSVVDGTPWTGPVTAQP